MSCKKIRSNWCTAYDAMSKPSPFVSSYYCLVRFVDVFSSLEQPAKMVLYSLASNPYDPPTALQELHSAMDDRVMKLRPKLAPPEVVNNA